MGVVVLWMVWMVCGVYQIIGSANIGIANGIGQGGGIHANALRRRVALSSIAIGAVLMIGMILRV